MGFLNNFREIENKFPYDPLYMYISVGSLDKMLEGLGFNIQILNPCARFGMRLIGSIGRRSDLESEGPEFNSSQGQLGAV